MLVLAALTLASAPRLELELGLDSDGNWAFELTHPSPEGTHSEVHTLSFFPGTGPKASKTIVAWGNTAARLPFYNGGTAVAAADISGGVYSLCEGVFRNTKMLRWCYTGDPVATDLKCTPATARCSDGSIAFDFEALEHEVTEMGEIRSGPADAVVAVANPTNAAIGPDTVVALKRAPHLRIVVLGSTATVWSGTDDVDTTASLILLFVIVVTLLNLTHINRYSCEVCFAGFDTAEELVDHCAEERPKVTPNRLVRWLRLPCDEGGQHAGLGCPGCYASFATVDQLRAHQRQNIELWRRPPAEYGLEPGSNFLNSLSTFFVDRALYRITLGLVSAIVWTVITSDNTVLEGELDLEGTDIYVLYVVFGLSVGLGIVNLYFAKCHGHRAFSSMAYTTCEILLLISLSYTIPKAYGELSTACLFLCGLGASIRLGRATDESLFPPPTAVPECVYAGAVQSSPGPRVKHPVIRAGVVYATIATLVLLTVLSMVGPMLYTVRGIHPGVVLPLAFLMVATGCIAPLMQSLYVMREAATPAARL